MGNNIFYSFSEKLDKVKLARYIVYWFSTIVYMLPLEKAVPLESTESNSVQLEMEGCIFLGMDNIIALKVICSSL